MARAGADTELGQNYLTYIGYVVDGETLEAARNSGNLLHSRHWTSCGSDLWGRGHPADMPRLSGVSAEEVTQFVLAGRELFYEKLKKQERTQRDVSILPSMAQFRTTRRLQGAYTLTEGDRGKHFEDSVGTVCDFFKPGHLYEVPYRTLYAPSFPNLWTAGRTISSTGWAWEVTRVIPVAVLTGQAAGLAATLTIAGEQNAGALDMSLLQKKLAASGVRLHIGQEK